MSVRFLLSLLLVGLGGVLLGKHLGQKAQVPRTPSEAAAVLAERGVENWCYLSGKVYRSETGLFICQRECEPNRLFLLHDGSRPEEWKGIVLCKTLPPDLSDQAMSQTNMAIGRLHFHGDPEFLKVIARTLR